MFYLIIFVFGVLYVCIVVCNECCYCVFWDCE